MPIGRHDIVTGLIRVQSIGAKIARSNDCIQIQEINLLSQRGMGRDDTRYIRVKRGLNFIIN